MTARAYRLPDGDWACELNAMMVYKGAANKADDMAKFVNVCLARGCQFVARRFSKKPSDKKVWHVIPTHEKYGDGDSIKSFGNSGNKADDWAAEMNAAVERGRPRAVMPAVPVPEMEAPQYESSDPQVGLHGAPDMDLSGTGLPGDQ